MLSNSDLISMLCLLHILRNKLRLADVLKSKTEENEAYLAEIEVGTPWYVDFVFVSALVGESLMFLV